MASIFTKIINGELPGRFVWKDGQAVSFLTINPVTPGHVLVVPRKEIDHWEQIDTPTFTHLSDVSQKIGRAVKAAYDAPRMGLLIAGLEVPHLHIHVFPAHTLESFDLTRAEQNPDPAQLDESARRIRASLRALGYQENVPEEPVG
ncbi:HIT family protein [Gordonia sp. VNK21]|uniref:HIT family protein n=1 Tax=Gordonia sp. VNK21 TaxID=3382483 RepID=UPI0038D48196